MIYEVDNCEVWASFVCDVKNSQEFFWLDQFSYFGVSQSFNGWIIPNFGTLVSKF